MSAKQGAHRLVVLLLLSSGGRIAHVSPSTAEVYPRACGGGPVAVWPPVPARWGEPLGPRW